MKKFWVWEIYIDGNYKGYCPYNEKDFAERIIRGHEHASLQLSVRYE